MPCPPLQPLLPSRVLYCPAFITFDLLTARACAGGSLRTSLLRLFALPRTTAHRLPARCCVTTTVRAPDSLRTRVSRILRHTILAAVLPRVLPTTPVNGYSATRNLRGAPPLQRYRWRACGVWLALCLAAFATLHNWPLPYLYHAACRGLLCRYHWCLLALPIPYFATTLPARMRFTAILTYLGRDRTTTFITPPCSTWDLVLVALAHTVAFVPFALIAFPLCPLPILFCSAVVYLCLLPMPLLPCVPLLPSTYL